MRWCSCGEALSASVQRNATETSATTGARERFVERANVLIALRACDLSGYYARNFWKIALPACQGRQPPQLSSSREARRNLIAPLLAIAYFWSRLSALSANEFSAFPIDIRVTKKMQCICEIDREMQSNPWSRVPSRYP